MLPGSTRETRTAPARPADRAALAGYQRAARRLLREASRELARLRRIRGASWRTAHLVLQARARLAFAAALLGAPLGEPALARPPSFVNPRAAFGLGKAMVDLGDRAQCVSGLRRPRRRRRPRRLRGRGLRQHDLLREHGDGERSRFRRARNQPLRPRRRGSPRLADLRRRRRRRRPRRLRGRALRQHPLLREHRHGERARLRRARRPTPSASPTWDPAPRRPSRTSTTTATSTPSWGALATRSSSRTPGRRAHPPSPRPPPTPSASST